MEDDLLRDDNYRKHSMNDFKKSLPVFRRGLKCIELFTTKNLSEWRDNLNCDDNSSLSHEVSIEKRE